MKLVLWRHWCMKFRCIQWPQRTNFTASGCIYWQKKKKKKKKKTRLTQGQFVVEAAEATRTSHQWHRGRAPDVSDEGLNFPAERRPKLTVHTVFFLLLFFSKPPHLQIRLSRQCQSSFSCKPRNSTHLQREREIGRERERERERERLDK